jgi:FMN-dependent oxidoreductase (nitrilotriacetate monooxygenase family)
LAAVTEKIGFIATASTTYYEPYNLARLFASVDHISGGRVGWNIVTTSADAAAGNFNLQQHPPHADRYRQATEFVEVVTKLWDSWEDDAIVADRESGLFADTDRIHPASHDGEFYRVRGALNLPRSPQGRPVYVQAGSSEDGRGFAARYAEAIFTAHQTLESARSFYSDIKRRVAATGRNPAHVKILPGIVPSSPPPKRRRESSRRVSTISSNRHFRSGNCSASPASIFHRPISISPCQRRLWKRRVRRRIAAVISWSSRSSTGRTRRSGNCCTGLPAGVATR